LDADRAPQLKAVVMPLSLETKILFAGLTVLVVLTNVRAQSKLVGTFPLEAQAGGNVAKVIFETRLFDRSHHRMGVRRGHTTIDGRSIFGATDAYAPQVEIASMKLYLNGREIHVPKRLYNDCYQPNLVAPYLTVRVDAKIVTVSMHGADGAAGYEVTWRFTNVGRASRSIHNVFP
jgi:hypothetical protein